MERLDESMYDFLNHDTVKVISDDINKLRKENAELKARLEKSVELPCKVGDVVYILRNSKIYNCEVLKFTVYKHVITAKLYTRSDTMVRYLSVMDFGKTVFPSYEAAEAALKESEKNE